MPHVEIAVVDTNILTALGLQPILTDIIPIAEVRIFISFEELLLADQGQFVHYFVASRIYFEHSSFFRENARRSIVLVNGDLQIAGVPTLNVCQDEMSLVKSILALHHRGHGEHSQAPHHAVMRSANLLHGGWAEKNLLSPREIEVVVLLTKGLINKEIADSLNIGLTTVITHRKNIMEKLRARSLADVIIYAVLNGLVDVGEI